MRDITWKEGGFTRNAARQRKPTVYHLLLVESKWPPGCTATDGRSLGKRHEHKKHLRLACAVAAANACRNQTFPVEGWITASGCSIASQHS
eukprot:scaffold160934_cov15-Tisochrysis_lutea.AAC.1